MVVDQEPEPGTRHQNQSQELEPEPGRATIPDCVCRQAGLTGQINVLLVDVDRIPWLPSFAAVALVPVWLRPLGDADALAQPAESKQPGAG